MQEVLFQKCNKQRTHRLNNQGLVNQDIAILFSKYPEMMSRCTKANRTGLERNREESDVRNSFFLLDAFESTT